MEREQLGGVDEESLVFLEALRLDGVGELDGDEVVPEVAEYLVDLAHLLLILEVDGRVEVRHVRLCHLDDKIILAGVRHVAQCDDALGRAKVALKAAAAAATAASTSAAASAASKTTPAATSASEAHFISINLINLSSCVFPFFRFSVPVQFSTCVGRNLPKWSFGVQCLLIF